MSPAVATDTPPAAPPPSPPPEGLPLRVASLAARALRPFVGEQRARAQVGHAYAIWTLLAYNVHTQYGRAVLGIFWTLLVPFLFLAIYLPIFSEMMGAASASMTPLIGSGRLAFPVFTLAGFLPWIAFSEGISSATGCLVGNPGLVHHSPIPLTILPTVKVLNSQVGLVVGGTLFVVFLGCVGLFPGIRLVLFPAAVGLTAAFGLGLGLLSSSLAVYFRDVTQLITTLLQIEFFAAPLLYHPVMIDNPIGRLVVAWNPATPFLNLFRASFIARYPFAPSDLALATVYAVSALLVGRFVFRRLEPGMADHV